MDMTSCVKMEKYEDNSTANTHNSARWFNASPQYSSKPVPAAYLRILNELKEIQNDDVLNIEAVALDDSIFKWNITFPAPNGKTVKAELQFDSLYPSTPPKMFIKQKLFHPHISDKGEVCYQCLKENYAPGNSIWHLILSVQVLLSEPNPYNPINTNAADLLLKKPEEYHEIASQCFNKLCFYEKGHKNLPDNASPKHSPKPVPGDYLRIINDLMEIKNDNTLYIKADTFKDSIFKWNITFPASNGKAVKADLHFNSQYPSTPPRMFIRSKLFHPNISDKGEVCFQALKESWAPRNSIWSLILSVQALLSEPNPHDPINTNAANFLLNKPEEYHEIASQCFDELEIFEKGQKYLPDNASRSYSSTEYSVKNSAEDALEHSLENLLELSEPSPSPKRKIKRSEPNSSLKRSLELSEPNPSPERSLKLSEPNPSPKWSSKQASKNSSELNSNEGYSLENSSKHSPPKGAGKRIFSDLMEIQNDNMLNIDVNVSEDSIFKWDITFPAPNGKGVNAELHFDLQYPYTPPRMFIKQSLFHPNISKEGRVCFQNFEENWVPTTSIWSVILSVQFLLSDPNPDDPANAHAANLLLNNPAEYHEIASGYFNALDFSHEEKKYEDEDEEIVFQVALFKSFLTN